MQEPITAAICGIPRRRHGRLVEEDAAEVLAVGEDLVLHRQEGTAGVDQVDAGQPVLQRHLLRAQVLLHGHRVVGAAFDGGVVGDDDDLAAVDPADPGDDPGAGRRVVVEAVGGERRELEEGRAGVEQPVDALARQQLAALDVALGGALSAAAVATAARRSRSSAASRDVLGLVALELRRPGSRVGAQTRLIPPPPRLPARSGSAPRSTWSPTATSTSATTPSPGALDRELHLHRLQHDQHLARARPPPRARRAAAITVPASAPPASRPRPRSRRRGPPWRLEAHRLGGTVEQPDRVAVAVDPDPARSSPTVSISPSIANAPDSSPILQAHASERTSSRMRGKAAFASRRIATATSPSGPPQRATAPRPARPGASRRGRPRGRRLGGGAEQLRQRHGGERRLGRRAARRRRRGARSGRCRSRRRAPRAGRAGPAGRRRWWSGRAGRGRRGARRARSAPRSRSAPWATTLASIGS